MDTGYLPFCQFGILIEDIKNSNLQDLTPFFSADDVELPRTKLESPQNTKKTFQYSPHVEQKKFAPGADESRL